MATLTWYSVNSGATYAQYFVRHSSSEVLILGTAGELCRSTNNGATWSKVSIDSGLGKPYGLEHVGGRWVAVIQPISGARRVYYSDNGGLTWARAADNSIAWMYSDGTTLFAYQEGSSSLLKCASDLVFSTAVDGSGAWWLHGSIGRKGVASDGAVLLAANDTDGTLMRSTDSGGTWSAVAAAVLTGKWVTGVFYLSDSDSWLVTAGNVIAQSTDAGLTWSAVSTTALPVNDVGHYNIKHVTRIDVGVLVLVTEAVTSTDIGLWRLEDGASSWLKESPVEYQDFSTGSTHTVLIGSEAGAVQYAATRFSTEVIDANSLSSSVVTTQVAWQSVGFVATLSELATATTPVSSPTLLLATVSSAVSGASPLSGAPLLLATVSSTASGASPLGAILIPTADAHSTAVALDALTLQAILHGSAYSHVGAAPVVPLEEDNHAVWVVNAETGASTRYENYPFNSFAFFDGAYYGCRSDGIYRLDGDTDNGAPIQTMMSFGKRDFGTSALKQVTHVYAGLSSGGRLFLKTIVNGEEFTYVARTASEDLRQQRFDLGRGLRANYLEFELYNADGDDFELASVEFLVVPLNRRI